MNELSYLCKINNDNQKMIDYIVTIIDVMSPIKYSPNGKFTNKYYFTCLLHFLDSHVSWRQYKGFPGFPMLGKTLHAAHMRYIRDGVYEAINKTLLEEYIKTEREDKLSVQLIDASFVENKVAIHNLKDKPKKKKKIKKKKFKKEKSKKKINHSTIKPIKNSNEIYNIIPIKNPKRHLRKEQKNKKKVKHERRKKIREIKNRHANAETKPKYKKNINKYTNNINDQKIQFNRYNGRKKYMKISEITDSRGTPLGLIITSGNSNEVSEIKDTINSIPVNINTKRNSTHNRYKQKFLADTGYYSNSNVTYLKELGYTPIIPFNPKNTKDLELIEAKQFTKKEYEIYKGRSIIESSFSWLKTYPVLSRNYEKTIKSYTGLLLLAASKIIFNRI